MDSDAAKVAYKEARQLYQNGQYAESLSLLEELRRQYLNYPNTLYARAKCLAHLGRISEARIACEHLSGVLGDPRGQELKQRLQSDNPAGFGTSAVQHAGTTIKCWPRPSMAVLVLLIAAALLLAALFVLV